MCDKKLKFVEYDRVFLQQSWDWLNDPEIKKLTRTPDFTKEQQEKFYLSLSNRNDYLIWGLTYSGKNIGAVGLKNIKNNTAEYFGYIGEKEYWSKGLFQTILKMITLECVKFSVKKIYLNVNRDNLMAIKAYVKNGFEINFELSTNEVYNMSIEVS